LVFVIHQAGCLADWSPLDSGARTGPVDRGKQSGPSTIIWWRGRT